MFFSKKNSLKLSNDLLQLLEAAANRARGYSHDYVGVEHVVLGFRDLPESSENLKVFKLLPIDLPQFWEDLERQARVVTGRPVPQTLPNTPRLTFVLKLAKKLAITAQKKETTPFHFLYAVARENNSLVAHVFRDHFKKKNPDSTEYHAVASHLTLLMTSTDPEQR